MSEIPERDYRFEVWQDGLLVAECVGADYEAVRRDAMHYALVYAQDGPVIVKDATDEEPSDEP